MRVLVVIGMRTFVWTRAAAVLGLIALGSMVAVAQGRKPEAKETASRSLKVKVNYTGAGTVDEKHKIFLFLFDSPDYTQGGVEPFMSKPVTSKTATALFEGVTVSPVYVVAVYDPSGQYDGESEPPQGASLGGRVDASGAPDPVKIEPGATAQVELTFDDSVKMGG